MIQCPRIGPRISATPNTSSFVFCTKRAFYLVSYSIRPDTELIVVPNVAVTDLTGRMYS
jgi:hypothetical protein